METVYTKGCELESGRFLGRACKCDGEYVVQSWRVQGRLGPDYTPGEFLEDYDRLDHPRMDRTRTSCNVKHDPHL